ncbi:MAG TPA: terminase small subunit [Burkholderiales bacterium]|nr:terminase small subunit [Burkholderiales bacterium]
MDTTLTFRQERFVFEYLKDQNASAAAARAGYTARNMASQGSELLNNPAIRDRVRFEMQSLLAEIRCSALELMKQRMRAAFFDAGKLLRGWEPIALEELDEETRRAVEVRTVLRKGDPVVHVKQPDRHRALRALEKVHERLDWLNEKYYAQLERKGEVPSLEEIERRADEALAAERAEAEAATSDISQKPQVLSGSGSTAAMPASRIFEKPQVFSGSELGAGTRAMLFPDKPMVLSGSESFPIPPAAMQPGAATTLLTA